MTYLNNFKKISNRNQSIPISKRLKKDNTLSEAIYAVYDYGTNCYL